MPTLYQHAFWTRPWQVAAGRTDADEIELWDFVALTWLVSILEIRRHSRIRLVTDARGRRFAENTGLAPFYNGGISEELDAIPSEMNPDLFWSVAKISSWLTAPDDCATLDTDLVLWRPHKANRPLAALHTESPTLDCYRRNRRQFGRYGFSGKGWNWRVWPLNSAYVWFAQSRDARYYAQTALDFAMACSRDRLDAAPPLVENFDASHTANFADQRLLPMCATRRGLKRETLAAIDPNTGHLAHNPFCSHLWLTKAGYQYCPEARATAVNFLILHIREQYPEALPLLHRWNLAALQLPRPAKNCNWRTLAKDGLPPDFLRLLPGTANVFNIRDPNFPIYRQSKSGELALTAEQEIRVD